MDENMLCTETHEYILERDDCFEVGITDYELNKLGDIVFVELPDIGNQFSQGEVFATIESIKGIKEVFMPITGTVAEINEEIVSNPDILNDENNEEKWFIKIESDANPVELANLLDYSDYKEEIE